MEQLIAMLKQYLSNTVVFASTAHGFHWNVEGPLFTEYHEFFGEIYEDVDGTTDEIAEWLRKFNIKSPYTLNEFIETQNIGDVSTESNSPITMSKMLYDINSKFIEDIKMMFDEATRNNEQGLADFLAARLTAHQKWGWFLRSILTPTIN
jgi:starvation-inducible DNA-binding protein